jgi:hypothetical protein
MIVSLLKKVLLLLGLIAGTIAVILWLPLNRPDHFLLATIDKENLLHRTPSPKIIVIGGSNTIFNIDSKLISDSTGLPVVNMGLHAGLGLKFMLNEIRPYLKPGDVVIIMPEYAQFFSDLFNGGRILTRLVTLNPHAFQYVRTRGQYLAMIKGVGLEARSKIVYLLGQSAEEETYNRTAFNAYGDLRSEVIGNQSLIKLQVENYEIRPPREINSACIKELNKFYAEVQLIGAQVYLAYSAIPLDKYLSNFDQIWALNEYLNRNLKVPRLFSPDKVLVPASEFFDTYYHLNNIGRQRYTEILIKYLSNQIVNN